jgi:hypothetical protein
LAFDILPNIINLEEPLVHLEYLDEHIQDAIVATEENNRYVKVQHDNSISPQQYDEGDLVLFYDQAKEPLGVSIFNPMWHGPYIMRCVLENGSYELEYYEGNVLEKLRNWLYLKIY